jgi:hypothetical protein
MRHEQRGSRACISDVLDPLAEAIDPRIQVLIQRLELTATMRGMRRQRQRRQQRLALAIPQLWPRRTPCAIAIACNAFCTRVRIRSH